MVSDKEHERIIPLRHLSKIATLKHPRNIAINIHRYEKKHKQANFFKSGNKEIVPFIYPLKISKNI